MENVRYTPRRLAEIAGATAEAGARRPRASRTPTAPRTWPLLRDEAEARVPGPSPPRIQLFLNFKGGTGKTSLSTSYAYRLAERGYRVLVHRPRQPGPRHQVPGQGGRRASRARSTTCWSARSPVSEVTIETGMPGLVAGPLQPGHEHHRPRAHAAGRPRVPAAQGAARRCSGKYDFVVMDAPPSFGLLNLNALMAADDLIVPVLADFLSYDGLRLLFETIQGLEDDLSHQLEHIFIVVNAFNQTFKIAREALEALRTALRRLPARQRGAPVHQVRPGLERGLPHLRLRPGLEGGERHRGHAARDPRTDPRCGIRAQAARRERDHRQGLRRPTSPS